jgi:hypothetical protein
MEPQQPGQSPSDAPRDPQAYALRAKEEIRAAILDARHARLVAPPRHEYARRLLFGLTAPFTLLRISMRHGPTRQSIVSRLTPPVVCVALAGAVWLWLAVRSAPETIAAARMDPSAVAADDDDDDDRKDQDEWTIASTAGGKLAVNYRRDTQPPARAPRPAREGGRASVLGAVLRVAESKLVKLLTALGVLEWILVWIGREHHDAIAYETAVLTGVPGDPLAGPPRLRLDARWLWTKAWRTARFLFFVALATPVTAVLNAIPLIGGPLVIAAQAAWTAYWASVFALANASAAWLPPPEAGAAPWFIRALRTLGRAPVVGVVPRLYAAALGYATRGVWPACLAFESASFEAAGLAIARTIASVPLAYLVLRPMFPPAATHALLGRIATPDGGG